MIFFMSPIDFIIMSWVKNLNNKRKIKQLQFFMLSIDFTNVNNISGSSPSLVLNAPYYYEWKTTLCFSIMSSV